jgi:hypothetical protein
MRTLPPSGARGGGPKGRLLAAVPSYFRSLDSGAFVLAIVVLISIGWLLVKLPEPTRFLVDPDWSCQIAGAQQIAFNEHPFVDWRARQVNLTECLLSDIAENAVSFAYPHLMVLAASPWTAQPTST